MKTLIIRSLLILLLATGGYSASATTPAEDPKTQQRMTELENRLREIKAMPLAELPKEERRALRKEVRSIKKEMAISGGVYISVGALLLILLLVLLLA